MTTCARQPDCRRIPLGALTTAEEHELMAHIAACPACQTTLSELDSLPGLLALVPRSLAELIDRSASRP